MSGEYSNPSLIILNELSFPILLDFTLRTALDPKVFAVPVESPVIPGFLL